MLDNVILLTSKTEGVHLGDVLLAHNPDLKVLVASDLPELLSVISDVEGETRLIAFCTGLIVPARALNAVMRPTYNFHPGPPTYPGSCAASFAIYDGAGRFGVTVHEMTERVDEGAIVAVDWFDLAPTARLDQVETEAYSRLAQLFFGLAAHLAACPEPLAPIDQQWSGKKRTKADALALQDLGPDATEEDARRVARAFG